MTKKGFCETNELKYDTFVRWTYRITPKDGEQMFVEIPAKPAERKSFTAGSSTVELECSGVTLRVPLCIDELELSRLLRAVENR
jgi:hypothetical protein